MQNLTRNIVIILAALVIGALAIYPPEKKIRLGKDLAGGATLVYAVDVKPGESDVVPKVIDVLKRRIDPNGTLEISIVRSGADRIEITMPLPGPRVKALRAKFEEELKSLRDTAVTQAEFDRLAQLPASQREDEAARLAGGNAERLDRINAAFALWDEATAARDLFLEAQGNVEALRTGVTVLEAGLAEGETTPELDSAREALNGAQAALAEPETAAAEAAIAYEESRQAAVKSGLDGADIRRALLLSTTPIQKMGREGTMTVLDSPRAAAIKEIRERFPEQGGEIDRIMAAWDGYERERRSLDDPSDLMRLIRGAGVLNFRITVDPGAYDGEQEARQAIREKGPRSLRSADARWHKINKVEGWVDSVDELERLRTPEGAAAHFLGRGYVVEKYKGEFFMLCWDRPGLRLTEDEGEWSLSEAYQDTDQLGRRAITFRMNAQGASKLGGLTAPNVEKRMAVLLDDEVYTAPVLNSRISNQGQISGQFDQTEIDYIVRVLTAGSLQAKLLPEPISQSIVGPEFGLDNLQSGLKSGLIAFAICAAFLSVYYFACGLIAVVGLLVNSFLLVAAMALGYVSFTLPGIAGVILTFAMAVDANVLIYERIREELLKGEDLKTAVRLGYQRALSAIVDGNLTNLIVCAVLALLGSPEIRGFGITMSIGVLSTLFAQLFVTRTIFALTVDRGLWRKTSMLPIAVPAVQRAFTLNVDWLRLRPAFFAFSAALLVGSLVLIAVRNTKMLDNEFVGGTEVTIQLKDGLTKSRAEVQAMVSAAAGAGEGSGGAGGTGETETGRIGELRNAEVVVVDPRPDGVTSGTFKIKTVLQDSQAVTAALAGAFSGVIDERPRLQFVSWESDAAGSPVVPIESPRLADSVELPLGSPAGSLDVAEFLGGAAVVLEGIRPAVSAKELTDRLDAMRSKADFSDVAGHRARVVVTDGDEGSARSAVVLIRSADVNYFDDQRGWEESMRTREWALSQAALTEASSTLTVRSFSAAVAESFVAQAVISVVFSCILIIVYVWVRFNSLRVSVAALAATVHDMVIAVGLIALAELVFESSPALAAALRIGPFKVDLVLVAAVLTILGYSINDKIVVMDRIRENKGKLPVVTAKTLNDSINQCFSRTIMTGTTTILSTIVLYVFGGEAVRPFAYALGLGVIVGTYSSIGVGAMIVWSKAEEERWLARRTRPAADRGVNGGRAGGESAGGAVLST